MATCEKSTDTSPVNRSQHQPMTKQKRSICTSIYSFAQQILNQEFPILGAGNTVCREKIHKNSARIMQFGGWDKQ